MLFIPLLRKEVHWSKRNLAVLGFLLSLVPVALGMTSVAFQEAVPENVPVRQSRKRRTSQRTISGTSRRF
jgi:hypothetical protein